MFNSNYSISKLISSFFFSYDIDHVYNKYQKPIKEY